jgi:hypothetical protein
MITATELAMSEPAEGIELVVLNGRIAVDGAEHTGAHRHRWPSGSWP